MGKTKAKVIHTVKITLMCGRYYRSSDKQKIAEAFALDDLDSLVLETSPSYNISPTSKQPVIVESRDTGERELQIMRWGMIPSWVKDPKQIGLSTINAKCETLMEKPMWRTPFEKRRCLVPANGFYEWQKVDAKTKQPFAFSLSDGQMFAFAGVWEHWKSPDGQGLDTYAILTTEPNELTAHVHNRIPVIIKPGDYSRWLHRDDSAQPPIDLLRPYDADLMTSWKVDANVGNVRNNEAGLIAPLKAV